MIRRSMFAAVLAALFVVYCSSTPSVAQEPTARMSDRAVEKLLDDIADQEKKFARALDSRFRKSVARGPGGEIDVQAFLDDIKEDIHRISDRFDGNYSASAEVKDLFVRADMMNTYMNANPSIKGANEWDVVGSSMQHLAAGDGTTFPLPDDPDILQ